MLCKIHSFRLNVGSGRQGVMVYCKIRCKCRPVTFSLGCSNRLAYWKIDTKKSLFSYLFDILSIGYELMLLDVAITIGTNWCIVSVSCECSTSILSLLKIVWSLFTIKWTVSDRYPRQSMKSLMAIGSCKWTLKMIW